MPTACSAVRSSRNVVLKRPRLQFSSSAEAFRFRPRHFSGSTASQKWQDTPSETAKNLRSSLCYRRCIVTGGASGIGYQISKQLVFNGASAVTIVSRTAAKAQQAIQDIKKDTGLEDAPLSFVECDFNDLGAFTRVWETSKQPFDTLINCAGISQAQGLLSTSSNAVSDILKVNLEAPIELSRQMLKEYFAYGRSFSKESKDDSAQLPSFCVINISSLLAVRGGYGTSIYSTSKAGLTAFTRTLALEAAAIRDKYPALPPFRANTVVPGYIYTPMIEKFSERQKEKLISEIPVRRYGKADEVADAVMFLLSNEYANNTVLNLDGGLSAI